MLVVNSPGVSEHAEHKASRMLSPSTDDGNTFDEMFDHELYAFNKDFNDRESLDKLDDLFLSQHTSTNYPQSPLSFGGPNVIEQSPPQPWRQGLWCLSQPPSEHALIEKTREDSRYQCSIESRALELKNGASVSPPTPSTVNRTKAFVSRSEATRNRHKTAVRPPICREQTLSPSPMYAQLPRSAKMEQVETWQQDFQNFHLRMPQDLQPASSQQSMQQYPGNVATEVDGALVSPESAIGIAVSKYDDVAPMTTNSTSKCRVDSRLTNPVVTNLGFYPASSPATATVAAGRYDYSQTTDQHVLPIWTTESLDSSSSSHQSYDTFPTSLPSTRSNQSAHSAFNYNPQPWFSPTTTTFEARQPCTNIVAPKSQRVPDSAILQSLNHPSNGLGIHYPEVDTMSAAAYQETWQSYGKLSASTTIPHMLNMSHSRHSNLTIPEQPYPPSYDFTDPSLLITPHKQRRSPSSSPTSADPATTLRQRSSSRHRRRKSLHKSGPLKETSGFYHDPLPSFSSSRPRSRSASAKPSASAQLPRTPKTPRTPRTPKTPTSTTTRRPSSSGGLDFVNFTPNDSLKLLSDVAPSGSSKTRARREAEAREKRKELGEVAMRAVRRAGGDVEAVKRAILT